MLNAGTLVTNMAGMLRQLIGEDIDLTVSVADRLDSVLADHSQVEQVVLNLAVNARDAMPRGGRLALDLTNEPIDGVPHVMLAVTDTTSA